MKFMNKLNAAFAAVGALLVAAPAYAAEGASSGNWGLSLAIGLGMGMAAMAGAIGQSRAAAAALEGIARNPNAKDQIQTPMILALAFIESLVLFTLVLMFILQGKL